MHLKMMKECINQWVNERQMIYECNYVIQSVMCYKMPKIDSQQVRNRIKKLKYTKNAKFLLYLISDIKNKCNPETNWVKLGSIRCHQYSDTKTR